MKKLAIMLGLIGLSFAGSITERIYVTPLANGKWQSANITIIGLGSITSANTAAGLNMKPGAGGFNVTGNIKATGIITANAVYVTTTVTANKLTDGTWSVSGGSVVGGVNGSFSQTVTAGYFAGDGSKLTNLQTLTTNVSGVNLSLSGALTANAIISNTSVSCNSLQVNGLITQAGNTGVNNFDGTVSANQFGDAGGAWTPTFSATVTFNQSVSGWIHREGKRVNFTIAVYDNQTGGGGGAINIGGFPYPIATGGPIPCAWGVAKSSTTLTSIYGNRIAGNAIEITTDIGFTNLNGSALNTPTRAIYMSGWYITP